MLAVEATGRDEGKKNEQFICAFKRDLGYGAHPMAVGEELEEFVGTLYKKYVRVEKIEDAAVKTTVVDSPKVTESSWMSTAMTITIPSHLIPVMVRQHVYFLAHC